MTSKDVFPCFSCGFSSIFHTQGVQVDAAGGCAGLHHVLRLRLQPAHRRGDRREAAAVDAAPRPPRWRGETPVR